MIYSTSLVLQTFEIKLLSHGHCSFPYSKIEFFSFLRSESTEHAHQRQTTDSEDITDKM